MLALSLAGQNCCAMTPAGAALQVQCVMHFLQLPIEDDLAELQPQQPIGMAVNGGGPALAPAEQPIPFADTGNPIMAQVMMIYFLVSPLMSALARYAIYTAVKSL